MNYYVCDTCCSDMIVIHQDKSKEMDCYCYNCKTENYMVSYAYAYRNKKAEQLELFKVEDIHSIKIINQ